MCVGESTAAGGLHACTLGSTDKVKQLVCMVSVRAFNMNFHFETKP